MKKIDNIYKINIYYLFLNFTKAINEKICEIRVKIIMFSPERLELLLWRMLNII